MGETTAALFKDWATVPRHEIVGEEYMAIDLAACAEGDVVKLSIGEQTYYFAKGKGNSRAEENWHPLGTDEYAAATEERPVHAINVAKSKLRVPGSVVLGVGDEISTNQLFPLYCDVNSRAVVFNSGPVSTLGEVTSMRLMTIDQAHDERARAAVATETTEDDPKRRANSRQCMGCVAAGATA